MSLLPYRPNALEWPLTSQGLQGLNDTLENIYTELRRITTGTNFLEDGADGDLIYFSGSWAVLPVGSNGQFLQVVAGLPAWGVDGSLLEDLNATEITSGTLDPARLADSGVAAGTYGDATHVSRVTVDAKGRVTTAVEVAISIPPATHSLLSTTHPDTSAASPALGDIIVAQSSGGLDVGKYFIDGQPFDYLPNANDPGAQAFWLDGRPAVGLISSGAVLWARKANGSPGYVLTAGATGPDWQPAGGGNTLASVYKAAPFTLSDNTLTDVILDTVESDPLAFWSVGSPTKLTVPVGQGGLYLIEAEATWNAGFAGMMYAHIYVNGVKRATSPSANAAASSDIPQLASALVQLNSGDYVTMTLQHIANTLGASQTILGGVTKTRLQLGRLASESVVKSDLPTAVAGNLIQGNPSATGYDRLVIGAAGTVLLSDGAKAQWSTRPTLRDVDEAVSGVWNFSNGMKARGRAAKEGEWTDVAFNAGDFTADAGVWTVAAGNVFRFAYTHIGLTVIVAFTVAGSTISLAPTDIKIKIPNGFIADDRADSMALGHDNIFDGAVQAYVLAGGTVINVRKVTGTWNNGGTISAFGTFAFEIRP